MILVVDGKLVLKFYDTLFDLFCISLEVNVSFLKAAKVGTLDCSCSCFFLGIGWPNREDFESSICFYFSSVFLNRDGPKDEGENAGVVYIVF